MGTARCARLGGEGTEVAGWAARFEDGCGRVDEIRISPLAILYSVDRDSSESELRWLYSSTAT